MTTALEYVAAIRSSGLSIYDKIEIGSELYIPNIELEALLNAGLTGMSTYGLPIRTRSKEVKQRVCLSLGYPTPSSFKKTKPRFPGQNFDTYVQAANNLQVWNDEVDPHRRYAIIQATGSVLGKVRVIDGEVLALLDKTGTLTQKYQARLIHGQNPSELISTTDSAMLVQLLAPNAVDLTRYAPTTYPTAGEILPIAALFTRLLPLVGRTFPDAGSDQERNRGAALHRMICAELGYRGYRDSGQFPDITHQLLEVKLQTSPTIDLGLVTPSSTDPLVGIPAIQGYSICHSDVRYAIFHGDSDGTTVTLAGLYLTTGVDFFSRFAQFQGKVKNKKLQIPLPRSFFSDAEHL